MPDGASFLDATFRLVSPRFFIPGTARSRYRFGLRSALRQGRPALIEVHADPVVALRLQRKFPAIPVVLVLHDEPAVTGSHERPPDGARLVDRIAGVVTVSAWLRDRFLEGMEAPARPLIVVPPCVDVARLPPLVTVLDNARMAQANRRSRVMLFVGRLVEEKGADLFGGLHHGAGVPARLRAEIIGGAEHMAKSPETQFTRLLQAAAEPAGISMMGYRDHPDYRRR